MHKGRDSIIWCSGSGTIVLRQSSAQCIIDLIVACCIRTVLTKTSVETVVDASALVAGWQVYTLSVDAFVLLTIIDI